MIRLAGRSVGVMHAQGALGQNLDHATEWPSDVRWWQASCVICVNN